MATFALVFLDDLGVSAGPEGRGNERLGLPASEQSGAVGARKKPDIDIYGANLVGAAVIETNAFAENLLSENLFFDGLDDLLDLLSLIFVIGAERCNIGVDYCGDCITSFEFASCMQGTVKSLT